MKQCTVFVDDSSLPENLTTKDFSDLRHRLKATLLDAANKGCETFLLAQGNYLEKTISEIITEIQHDGRNCELIKYIAADSETIIDNSLIIVTITDGIAGKITQQLMLAMEKNKTIKVLHPLKSEDANGKFDSFLKMLLQQRINRH